MELIAMIFLLVGGIISLVGSIWFLIVAFKESILWGVGCFLIPFVSLIFLIMHIDKAGKPFGVSLLGTVILVMGSLIAGGI